MLTKVKEKKVNKQIVNKQTKTLTNIVACLHLSAQVAKAFFLETKTGIFQLFSNSHL